MSNFSIRMLDHGITAQTYEGICKQHNSLAAKTITKGLCTAAKTQTFILGLNQAALNASSGF